MQIEFWIKYVGALSVGRQPAPRAQLHTHGRRHGDGISLAGEECGVSTYHPQTCTLTRRAKLVQEYVRFRFVLLRFRLIEWRVHGPGTTGSLSNSTPAGQCCTAAAAAATDIDGNELWLRTTSDVQDSSELLISYGDFYWRQHGV
jgi:hypothetical protein